MLTPRPHGIGTARLPSLAQVQASLTEAVARARVERLAHAEVLAGRGTIEIYLDFNDCEIDSVWSHGVYALLERDPRSGPLARDDFVTQYVHREDRAWLLAASRKALAGDTTTELRYRIVTTSGRMLDVRESTSRVASGANCGVMFADLEEVKCVERRGPPPPLSAAMRALSCDATQAPSMHTLVAAFDALRDGEQRRLTREMHDDFGQLLAAMKVDLSLIEREALQRGQPPCKHVASLHELVDAMLISVRRIIADLPPLAIEEHGLFGALDRLACNFRKRHPLLIQLRTGPIAAPMSESLELSIYRIIQEALNNIVRHAEARNASISLSEGDSNIQIVIQDDGRGTSNAQLRKSGSYGLASMQERVAALRGTMTITGEQGKGTRIQIAIPASSAGSTMVP